MTNEIELEATDPVEAQELVSGDLETTPETIIEKTENQDTETVKSVSIADLKATVKGTKIVAISDTRVAGYLVRFGSVKERDVAKEWFTKSTDLGLGIYDKLPWLYDHAGNNDVKSTQVGVIDTFELDDSGLWVEAEYNKANKYKAAIKNLVSRGVLDWSSGCMPQTVIKSKTGEIVRWWIIEGSSTPTPADFRGALKHSADIKSVSACLKNMGLNPDELELMADGVLQSEQEKPKNTEVNKTGNKIITLKTGKGNIVSDELTLTQDELDQKIADAVTANIKSAEVARVALEAAKVAEAERISKIVEEQVAAKLAGTPIKQLPVSGDGDVIPGTNVKSGDKITVTRATKYSELSASDMSYLGMLLQSAGDMNGSQAAMNVEFQRELADKTIKAVGRKELGNDALETLTKNGFLKTGELDYSTSSGFGSDWVPDTWRAELWLKVRQDNVVAPLFEMIEMPSNPYELPIEGSDPTTYYVPETTDIAQLVLSSGNAVTASKAGSGKVQMSAKKLAIRQAWSTELNEDSLIPVVANYRRQAIRAMQDSIDNVILNGDTVTTASTNINAIDNTPAAGTKYLAFDGLRKYSILTNTGQIKDALALAPTVALFRQTRFKLAGKYALRPQDLAWIVDNLTYSALLALPEFLTADKLGTTGTSQTGFIGRIDGVDVFASSELGQSLSTGKIQIASPTTTNILGNGVIVSKPQWKIGYRRAVTAVVEPISWADAFHMLLTARLTLVNFSDAANSAILVNLTV